MSRKLTIVSCWVAILALGVFTAPACQGPNPAPADQVAAIRSPEARIRALTAPRPSMRAPEQRNLWSYSKAADQVPPYRPGTVVVRFQEELRGQVDAALAANLGLSIRRASPIGVHLMNLVTNETVEQAVARLNKDPRVRYAEPDHRIRFLNTPNDPRFSECWGLHNTGQTGGTADADIDAVEAWNISIGSWDVVVAVLDTGVDYTHPDLAANMWTNQDEIAGNGIDDDNNGYIDDVIGWDFENQVNDPMDDYGHGTHCAGTIGAVGNDGLGVAGVNWRVTIMPLRIIGNQELDAYCLDAAESIHYAVDNGAHVMSCSWWTVEHYNQTLEEAVEYSEQMGVLLVAAAGNDSRDDDDPGYNHWPSEWPYDNIIAVAATNHNDGRASFSNWGPISVDVGAPGEDILSTVWPGHGYDVYSGTSMATPHTAGTVALMMSIRPDLTSAEIRQFLFQTVDPIPDLQGITVTGGRINAYTALAAISGVPLPPVALAGGDQTVMTGSTVVLDGSSSFDPNQDPITYLWEFFPPALSSASLDDELIATPQFLADVCGLYQANLTVSDDGGLVSAPDRARVHVMNWSDQNPVIETPHPYTDNMDQTWTITIPGAVVMGVHFASFDTERGYDFVRILDGDDAEFGLYDGALGEFNSLVVDGNTIKIRFTSDGSVTGDGFVLDGVWWCDAGNCPPGQGDCNEDPADGCETDTSADINNCGWCGHGCSFPNASATCNAGLCELVTCQAGFEDCDGNVINGCESDPLIDPNNCGLCGTVCGPYANATAGCSNGGCVIEACDAGWDDCNGVLADGCETSVVADPDNCGGCGVQCILDHAVQTYCEDAVCHVGECTVVPQSIETAHPYSNGQDLTWQIVHPGAIEISVHFAMFNTERNYDYVQLRDGADNLIVQYWGDLGPFTADPVPGDTVNIVFHSDSSVVYDGFIIDSSRYCGGTGCEAGWGDCDGLAANGCETDVLSSLDHCGACGQLCGDPHTDGQCNAGACTPGSNCLAGWGDCNSDMADGCESDLNNDPATCGDCATACSDVYPNAEVGCASGACAMGACFAGFDDCNTDPADGCEIQIDADPDNCGLCGQVCDLDHVAVNGCLAGGCVVGLANCASVDHPLSSPHPYPNSYDETWEIRHPGAGQIRVHFTALDVETSYDYVIITDGDGTEIARYTGSVGVVWSDWVRGDTIRVRLTSDSIVQDFGFDIDVYEACDSGCDSGWDNCDGQDANGCEADVSADPDNCGACGAACFFDHASGSCQNNTCVIASCDAGFDDCNSDGWDGCESELASDLDNCGGCGIACSDVFPNANVTCNAGVCEMGACLPGYADCNADPVDGCEVNFNTDPDHCGACGQACSLDHATAGCAAGACTVAACDSGWGNCDNVTANGCEQDVQDDDANCGGCGVSCDVDHASAHCAGVVCLIDACDADYADCDANERNGCEAHLPSDVNHCAGCGNACEFPGATAICQDGVCALGDCALNLYDCNADPTDGCEANVMTDASHCGQCGFACTDNHADSQCINGMCFMGDCHAGFANCNHNNADGCEVNTAEDADNCGACDVVCSIAHATAACSGSECVVAACSQGWGDCDAEGFNGCEVDLGADPNHCGGCGQACDLANATSECQAGQCALDRCDNGFDDCNNDDADGCEVNKLADASHCGHCSVACPSGQTCEMGVCTCADADGDGYEDQACGGDDCQDDDSLVNPAAAEECGDGIDNDCDGRIDENCDTEPPDDGGGCGCATSSRPAAGLLWLALIGLVVARRRRR
jgi:MYXO-CTERM domain-containing protein